MSNPHLPADLLDHVVDHLHDTRYTLRNCCLASHPKAPFCPRRFPHPKEPAVMEGDVSGSFDISRPLHQNSICWLHRGRHNCRCGGGWLGQRFFSHRALEMDTHGMCFDLNKWATPLAPFHGLSPTIKSLRVFVFPPSTLADFQPYPFIPSSRGLAVDHYSRMFADNGDGSGRDEIPTAAQPLAPPMFTGSLGLRLRGGM